MEKEIKPWLMYFPSKGRKTQTFCNISDPTKSYSTRIPDHLRKSRLLTVQHGWYLCENKISKYVSNLFLWNPLNLKKIKLPFLQHNGTKFGNYILSCPPTTNDEICSIFIFSSHSPSLFYYQLEDKEKKQWTPVSFYNEIVLTMKSGSPVKENKSYFDNPVYCNGCLYAGMWTSSSFIIVVIEKLQYTGFTIDCTSHPMVKFQSNLSGGFEQLINQLIGFNNVLFRIIILHALDRVVAVFVYKFDCSQRVWEKVESIKDKVFFISSIDSAFACQASNPEIEGGRVYIALKNCNFFYIYNTEDKSLVTSHPFSNLSKKKSYPRWFMPDIGKDITKAHQIREKENICNGVYLKEIGDKDHNEYALSIDVLEVIAKSINNVLDYLHFRASNKLLRLTAPSVQWRSYSSSMSMSRFDYLSMCPLFVFSDKDKVFTFVHPKHGLNYKNIINFPQSKRRNSLNFGFEICCAKDGWLLLVAIQNGFQVFFNPFTKEVLPPIRHNRINNMRCFGISHSPTSTKCVTVELNKELAHFTTAYVHLFREDILDSLNYEDKDFSLYNTSPAFHNGLFYFLSVTGKLGVIEVREENISWKLLEKLHAPCSTCFNNFLIECDGNLLSVFESPFAKGVQVFKLNESAMTWKKVENLKNHMLFVGKTSFSVMANIPEMENKIYFPRFYGQNVVFYSLETNNYHTFENDQVVNFHQMREHLNGTWIQPRWH